MNNEKTNEKNHRTIEDWVLIAGRNRYATKASLANVPRTDWDEIRRLKGIQ